jgi:hypothetical protein
VANELGQSIQTDPQAYAKLIQGELELERGRPRDALRLDSIWDALMWPSKLLPKQAQSWKLVLRDAVKPRLYSWTRYPLTTYSRRCITTLAAPRKA